MRKKILLCMVALPFWLSAQKYESDKTRNLTIVYLVPSDLEAVDNYEVRISKLMLYTQEWFKKQMKANGYGDKTFGMLKDESLQRVKINFIQSKNNKEYLNSGANLTKEIDDYFAGFPDDKTSQHVLILMPPYYYIDNDIAKPEAGPFFGYGNYCVASDNQYMDIDVLNSSNKYFFTRWVGGMIHELGHAFQLKHNNEIYPKMGDFTKSIHYNFKNFPFYSPSMMTKGNSSLEVYNTILTPADCAILNFNEVFNDDDKKYYGNTNSGLSEIRGEYDETNKEIKITGKFFNNPIKDKEAIHKVENIVFFADPNYNNEGTGIAKDYNAISWCIKPQADNSFSINIPLSNLQFLEDTSYELKVKLIHNNGKIKQTTTYFSFKKGIPFLSFSMPANVKSIDRYNWSIKASSVQSNDFLSQFCIDDNVTTHWQSKNSAGVVYPHTINIDLGSIKEIKGFSYFQREDEIRTIKNVEIETSNDGVIFEKTGTYTFKNEDGFEYVNFLATHKFRHFRLKAISGYSKDDPNIASLADIKLYEVVNDLSVHDLDKDEPFKVSIIDIKDSNIQLEIFSDDVSTKAKLKMYNLLGQLLYSKEDVVLINGSNIVDISCFNKGFYVFKMEVNGKSITKKISIK